MLHSYVVECLVAVDSWAFGHLSRLPTVGPDIGQLGGRYPWEKFKILDTSDSRRRCRAAERKRIAAKQSVGEINGIGADKWHPGKLPAAVLSQTS